ncbi:hypothetical protein WJX81_006260 [Elliptochloris bilobata]|uniref:Exonuclease domain-containing protein n=1 Tax=Elliptochloris bilobata TaxID=381761 RepID=A0AAW1SJM9_9CHLO
MAAAQELEEGEIAEDADVGVCMAAANETAEARLQAGPASGAGKKAKKKRKQAAAALAAAGGLQPAAKKERQAPAAAGFYDVYGQDARASVQPANPAACLRMQDVQGLVMWVLADGANPRWVFVKNKPLVRQVVVVAVPGLSEQLVRSSQELMPTARDSLGRPLVMLARNPTVRQTASVAALFTVPHTKARKKYLEELANGMDFDVPKPSANPTETPPGSAAGRKAAKEAASGGTRNHDADGRRKRGPLPPGHYAASRAQLEANEFPLLRRGPGGVGAPEVPEGFVATQPSGAAPAEDPEEERLVALDCEMCITEAGFEVTRITLVSEAGEVLMDELVKPDRPITDYNTRYSGITAEMMADVQTRLPQARARLAELLPAEALLVGHALQNDLAALKLVHGRVIDTALLYPHPRGSPYRSALRVIAERFLKRQIQAGSHDSVDDARAAMDLALLKIRRGPAFGTGALGELQGDRLVDRLAAAGRRCMLVDRQDMLSRHVTGSAGAVVCVDDDECADKAAREARAATPANFLWTQFREVAQAVDARGMFRRAEAAATAAERSEDEAYERIREALRATDMRLARLHDALQPNALLLVLGCQGDTFEVRRLQEQKWRCQQKLDGLPPWSVKDEERLMQAVNAATRAMLCCAVKR